MLFLIHNERKERFRISQDQAYRDTAGLMRMTL